MSIEDFVRNFNYETRKDMKISSKELMKLLKERLVGVLVLKK